MTDNDKADLAERLQARLDAGLAEAASWPGSHVADCIVRALHGEPVRGVQAAPVAAGALEAKT